MDLKKYIVTTGGKEKDSQIRLAKEIAEKLGIAYIPRGKLSLEDLREKTGADNILVARSGQLLIETPEGEMFFHPSMAHLRIKNIRQGKGDHLVEALAIEPGMRILDCTLGLGSDAIVESYAAGETGHVTALEANAVMAEVVRYGLSHCESENPATTAAMRRIEVVAEEHLSFLRSCEDNSYDAVYFDPMFRHPFQESSSIAPLRSLADPMPLSEEALREALRVSRGRVVLKETSKSTEFDRLGFQSTVGGKYSKVKYGILQSLAQSEGKD